MAVKSTPGGYFSERGKLTRTVLVVDDDPDFLDILAAYVGKAGYHVLRAAGAFQALEILDKNPPDAMILDIMMPDRTGIEVLEHVRWDPRLKRLAVICISAVFQTPEAVDFIDEFSLGLMDKADIPAIIGQLKEVLPLDENEVS